MPCLDYPVVPFLSARILPSGPSWHFDHATCAVPRYIQLSNSACSSSSISKRCVAMLLQRALLSSSFLHSAMLTTPPCILFCLSSLFLLSLLQFSPSLGIFSSFLSSYSLNYPSLLCSTKVRQNAHCTAVLLISFTLNKPTRTVATRTLTNKPTKAVQHYRIPVGPRGHQ